MRAAALTAPGQIEVVDREQPKARGDLVVVKILVAPMCTEFKDRRNGSVGDALGHEAAGVVIDPGSSTRVAAGDRVVVMPQYGCGVCWLCTSGEHIYCPNQRDVLKESRSSYGTATYAQYLLKPDWLLLPIPADVSMRRAALTCCGLGPTFTAHTRMATTAVDSVAVSGCGPVGLGGIVHAVTRGCRVVALETQPYRAALANRLGASLVVDPRDDDAEQQLVSWAAGRGVDAAIETSGAPTAPSLLARGLRRRGRLAIVAWGHDVTLPPLVPLGLDIAGCWHWNHQRHAEEMWTTVRAAGDLLDLMITHEFGLEDVAAAMDVQDLGECGKVLLFPHGPIDREEL
jgi:threonine dehydrogenase-like Zn-dependent dehydrogenase